MSPAARVTLAPRVAFFPDSFAEVNGVAHTSRQFEAFARRSNLPFLTVRAGPENRFSRSGALRSLELKTSALRIPLEADLRFDLAFLRHLPEVLARVSEFRPDLVHITGPSHLGILGVLAAHRLRLPLVASWHTNLHEYSARRIRSVLDFLPSAAVGGLSRVAESQTLRACTAFYRLARFTLAPNPDLCDLLRAGTGKPSYLMCRGVDTELFSPAKRLRNSDLLTLGYVGRLSPEKNVRLLRKVVELLKASPEVPAFRLLIVGQGSELTWLRQHLSQAEFVGVKKGEDLAAAFAEMDIFLFPSHTDTFGNVIQEAMASGVPSVVTASGGPRFVIAQNETGLVSLCDEEFPETALRLARDPQLRKAMSVRCREAALSRSWDRVFLDVYNAYTESLPELAVLR